MNGKNLFVMESLLSFLRAVESAPNLFDEKCGFNIEHIGPSLISRIGGVADMDFASRDEMFASCFRFLIEFQLGATFDIASELNEIVHKVHDHEWTGNSALQIKFAEHQMLIGVMKKFINHPRMITLRDLPSVIEKSQKEREILESQLASRETRIDALHSNLKKYESAFNFVALYDGFKSLRNQKRRESFLGLMWLIVLGGIMIAPFVGKLYMTFNPIIGLEIDVYSYASLVGLELVLLFLFRVALHGYRNVKAQLIQIDLRMALCQFIQGYAEYASEVRKKDAQLLDRFDQLIFSGIVASEGAIPSTFDGFDQLANLIAKFKDAK